jgi:antitoxin component HigA of HigAB toxin-antitoxin module
MLNIAGNSGKNDYEKAPCPCHLSAIEMLRFLMVQRAMNAADLGRLLGERACGEKILRGERDLTKADIRILADYFKVNPGLFL